MTLISKAKEKHHNPKRKTELRNMCFFKCKIKVIIWERNFHCDVELTASHPSFPATRLLFPGIHRITLFVSYTQSRLEHFANQVWLLGLVREINFGLSVHSLEPKNDVCSSKKLTQETKPSKWHLSWPRHHCPRWFPMRFFKKS